MMFLPLALVATLGGEPADKPAFESLSEFVLQDEDELGPEWTGAVTVGVSVADGNTETMRASATADAQKKVDSNRYTLNFSWNYAEEEIGDETEITQRRTYGAGKVDHFIDEKSYFWGQVTAMADKRAGVDLRWTAGGGYGYQFRDDEKWKINGEAGLTYFSEEFADGTDDDYVAARLAYDWTYIHSERWEFSQRAEIFPSIEDPDQDIYARVDTRAKATLTEAMFAQLQWLFDWDNTPAEGQERADHLYLLTVGWKF